MVVMVEICANNLANMAPFFNRRHFNMSQWEKYRCSLNNKVNGDCLRFRLLVLCMLSHHHTGTLGQNAAIVHVICNTCSFPIMTYYDAVNRPISEMYFFYIFIKYVLLPLPLSHNSPSKMYISKRKKNKWCHLWPNFYMELKPTISWPQINQS